MRYWSANLLWHLISFAGGLAGGLVLVEGLCLLCYGTWATL